ncbi:hypothetical protein [Mycoplasma sp. Ms02]|uniref:hypothetical protein n=1 Tax=Mycoplasma sp. Ms02 TaxID=353851 RepID=UPI001C890225|nr:hypothetical protein [Mycoplasma sp. Ms02]QZE12528.1 hypothetical protein K4L35_00870 [Mycoplasma sp. Ms02]
MGFIVIPGLLSMVQKIKDKKIVKDYLLLLLFVSEKLDNYIKADARSILIMKYRDLIERQEN